MARRHDSVKTTRRRPAAVFCFCSPARARRKPELMRNQHYSTPARNFILMAMPRARRPAKKNCFCAPDSRRVAIAHNAAQLTARNCRRMPTTARAAPQICPPAPDAARNSACTAQRRKTCRPCPTPQNIRCATRYVLTHARPPAKPAPDHQRPTPRPPHQKNMLDSARVVVYYMCVWWCLAAARGFCNANSCTQQAG